MLSRHQHFLPDTGRKALSAVITSVSSRSCKYCGAVVLACASTCASAITSDDITFNGYARSGIGASTPGGDQLCFVAAGAPARYRLGNECNTYAELDLGAKLFDQNGITFDLDTNVSYETLQIGDNDATFVQLKEMYILAKGLLSDSMPKAALWAGKRFYRQHEVHMIDFKYWNITGPGVGIENIDVGLADFSVAWVRNETNVFSSLTVTPPTNLTTVSDLFSTDIIPTEIFDFRLTNIDLADYLSLDIGFDFGRGQPANRINSPDINNKDRFKRNGWMVTGDLVWSLGDLDRNSFVLQYAKGAMTGPGVGASATTGLQPSVLFEGSKMYRVFDHGSILLTERLDLLYMLGYTQVDFPNVMQIPAMAMQRGSNTTWITAGIRPAWKWTDWTSTALEIGYDQVKNVFNSAAINTGTTTDPTLFTSSKLFNSSLTKITIAQIFQPDFGNNVRPQIRIFATYAKWKAANGCSQVDKAGTSTTCPAAFEAAIRDALGLSYDGATSAQQVFDTFVDKRNGWTFGAQMEAWW